LKKKSTKYYIHRYFIPKGLKILHKREKRMRKIFESKYSHEIESLPLTKGKGNIILNWFRNPWRKTQA